MTPFITPLRMFAVALALALTSLATAVTAQNGPLRIDITEGVIEPLPFAVPDFIAENPAGAEYAAQLSRLIAADLAGTGLFREIPSDAFITQVSTFSPSADYPSWKAINAQALITGAVSASPDGRLTVKFRVFDVFSEAQMGEGLQLEGTTNAWRRMGHKVADAVYSRITGEGGYFDSRVVYVAETGPKNERKKRLAVMDYDGANVQYLTDSASIVLAPRFSPTGDRILYTSYETGFPQIYQLDVGNVSRVAIPVPADSMTFAPRYAPDGQTVVFSASQGGNTDIYRLRPGGSPEQLTNSPSIETAPSYSPDGNRIVFESDRSGSPQLYIMPANGGESTRISFGAGRYGTPVWSPRGDLVAFTKQNQGRFHIGVMRTDGSEERLLTSSFLDEGPTWAPNGRVIMFMRESSGAGGESSLYSVDISGRNLKKVPLEGAASDPAWSPLLK
ncbi:Tol-Pal system beta propeller repeat protein TolB [Oceaniovalibus sp. ACAM 378]|uniref:Tol-Pal system beta propeller repeat protein TolB n=1 Tax=Oceaniovalibus sp. ACAM 378 TaxID=2599923 RepID=UPI0011D3EC46|nr:Tol-Pal system beta propeller repeat protein TolB [Oceaniovalibus sp. ACAM 378]TYB84883.1 Tol-Pal system protein TolB [Oceaniovalibus sp. ACAM 378]